MATSRLCRLTNPEVLASIDSVRLRELLKPHHRSLFRVGVSPKDVLKSPGPLDPAHLAARLADLDQDTPHELVTMLFLIDEMATPEGMDVLIDAAAAQRLELELASSPADIAVQVALAAPALLERKHAERAYSRVKSYVHFGAAREGLEAKPVTKILLRRIEDDLDQWFESRNRGRGSSVFPMIVGGSQVFMIRHGRPLKREETLRDRKASSICYRPAVYDVVLFNAVTCELSVHAGTKGEQHLYRRVFGEHLFNDADMFPGEDKYTLKPLRTLQADALAPGNVDGIETITLRECQFRYGGAPWEIQARTSNDLFALFEHLGQGFPNGGELIRAKFAICFSDSDTPRQVTIKPPNVALYARDGDREIVEQWLALRGFIKSLPSATLDESEDEVAPVEALVGA
jgi:hypothetical protein